MSKPITNVKLAFPCPENFDSFEYRNGKRFCEKCKHAVNDFTNATDETLQKEISKSKDFVCGQFKHSQLQPGFFKYAAAAAVATGLSQCAPENISPTNEMPPQENVIENEREPLILGVVFIPDSVNLDSTLVEQLLDEDRYKKEEDQ